MYCTSELQQQIQKELDVLAFLAKSLDISEFTTPKVQKKNVRCSKCLTRTCLPKINCRCIRILLETAGLYHNKKGNQPCYDDIHGKLLQSDVVSWSTDEDPDEE